MYRKSFDLLLILVFVTGATILAFSGLTNTIFNLVFGLPLVFVLPGYALVEAIFIKADFRLAERVLLVGGLSLVLTVLGGFILNLTPFGLQPVSWTILLSAVTGLGCSIALLRRRGQGGQPSHFPRPTLSQSLLFGLAALLTLAAIIFSTISAGQDRSSGFTQLWLLQADQNSKAVRIGFSSTEQVTLNYRLQLKANGTVVQEWSSLQIAPQQKWEMLLSLPPNEAALSEVEAVLYRLDQPTKVYRRATLILSQTTQN